MYHEGMRFAMTTLAAARLSRFVTTDDLGQWLIKDPIDAKMDDYQERETEQATDEDRDMIEPWWWKYRSGLDCPWCVGYWAALGLTATDAVLPDKGLARGAFTAVTSALAVNYVAATINSLETT